MKRRRIGRLFGGNLASLRRWRSAGHDVREEMRLHVDLRAAELAAAGLPPEEARARAAREVGTPDAVAPLVEATAASTDRTTAMRQFVDETLQDVRYALRSFRRAPGWAVVALLTIALGMGANTAILGLVNVTFLAPLPFDPDNTLVRVREYRDTPGGARAHVDASRRTADAVAARPDLFRDSVALAPTGRTLGLQSGAIRVDAMRVGPRFVSVIGVPPVIGRSFTSQEENAGDGSGVVLISHRLWETAFGADPGVLGRTVRLDGEPFAVVGVLPPRFHVPYGTDVWFPSHFGEDERSIFILARRAPGVSLEQVRAALEPVGRTLASAYPDVMRGLGVTAVGARDYFAGDETGVALALMASVGFLLLIACSNVALLLATKFAARQQEVAIRAALGCGRARQVRQFVTEGLVLFIAGGSLGLLAAIWLSDFLVVFLPEAIGTDVGIQGIPVDSRLLVSAAVLSVGAGIAFGLIAACRAARADPAIGLRTTGRSVGAARSRGLLGTLAAAQVALALALLTGAGVSATAFQRLQQQDLGFSTEDVLTFRVDLNAERYASAEARRAFVDGALERLRALPGVQAAGATTVNPLCCGNWGMRVTPEGYPVVPAEQIPVVQHFVVTPGYVEAMRLAVVDGRTFTPADGAGAEWAVIVDDAFARRFWPGERAVGKRVKRGPLDSPHPWLTVVGVIAAADMDRNYAEAWYLPHAQHATDPSATAVHVMVRASHDLTALVPLVRGLGTQLDPNLALYDIRTMAAIRRENLRPDRLGALVTSCFALAGLLLSSLGLYGVLSFAVAQDTREIGVRLALGASRARVLRLVLARGLRILAAGLLAGALAAWLAARLFGSFIGDAQLDPQIMAAAALVLLVTGAAAIALPARRAVRLAPTEALRAD